MADLNTLFFGFLAIITSAAPIPLLKLYDSTKNILWLSLAVVSNIVLIFAYVHFLKNANIEIAYAFIKIASIIAVVFFSVVFFEMPLHAKTVLGLVMGFTSLYLLSGQTAVK